MGTSGTASIVDRLLDLSLFTALFAALGAISVGVVAGNPVTLRGTGACMIGGGDGASTGNVITDGGLSGQDIIWELTTPAFSTCLLMVR